MKKLALAFAIAFAASAASALDGSHNFAAAGADDSCKFCHTPHNANTGVAGAPLWNRDTQTFTFTDKDATIRGTVINAPGDRSLTCLACHEGSISMSDIYGTVAYGTVGNVATVTGNTQFVVGLDLTNDHPVGVAYNTANALNAFTAANNAVGALPIPAQRVECASCHEPHISATAGVDFLRVSNAGGALCITCHIK